MIWKNLLFRLKSLLEIKCMICGKTLVTKEQWEMCACSIEHYRQAMEGSVGADVTQEPVRN